MGQRDWERQGLNEFVGELFAEWTQDKPTKDRVPIADLADYLISLGLCPDSGFLLKVRNASMGDVVAGDGVEAFGEGVEGRGKHRSEPVSEALRRE